MANLGRVASHLGNEPIKSVDTEVLAANTPHAIERAAQYLAAGELVVFPTDTVYGLAADLRNQSAIRRLFKVKGRDSAKAIAVLLSRQEHLGQVSAEVGEMAERLARRFWPGPLTLVVLRHPVLPEELALTPPGGTPTIGIRMPSHPTALALLDRTGPLAVTSANLSGHASCVTAQEVYSQLSNCISLILDGGKAPGGQPSTVVDCTGSRPILLRLGPITEDMILAALE